MREEVDHALGGDLAEVLKLRDLLGTRDCKLVKRAEAIGKCRRRDLAYVSYSERVDQSRESCRL